jgi:indoleamine 2,3-dioxygenase
MVMDTASQTDVLLAGRGFLPREDPLQRLLASHAAWDELGRELPRLLAVSRARAELEKLAVLDASGLSERELERAMLLLSFFGHAAVFEKSPSKPGTRVPRGVAVPWAQVAERLGRPPALAYASHALQNWRRLDPTGPIAVGNLATLQTFLGGPDEEWFILLHVAIEAAAAPGLAAIDTAQRAVASDDSDELTRQLHRLAEVQARMYATLLRMTEGCDPHIFFTRIQPFLHGLQEVVYEGVAERPQSYPGASAAEGLLLPLFDAALGIEHERDELAAYLDRLHQHAPVEHRRYLAAIAAGASIRAFVTARREPVLRDGYNECVAALARFRAKHFELTVQYAEAPARRLARDGPGLGTGGTPFLRFLPKYADETARHLIE